MENAFLCPGAKLSEKPKASPHCFHPSSQAPSQWCHESSPWPIPSAESCPVPLTPGLWPMPQHCTSGRGRGDGPGARGAGGRHIADCAVSGSSLCTPGAGLGILQKHRHGDAYTHNITKLFWTWAAAFVGKNGWPRNRCSSFQLYRKKKKKKIWLLFWKRNVCYACL